MKPFWIGMVLITSTTNIVYATDPFQYLIHEPKTYAHEPKTKFFYALKAANENHVKAQYELAMMYANGSDGAPRDELAAFTWFHKAALNGHIEAMYYVGVSFYQGRGVVQDKIRSIRWFKMASEHGHAKAKYWYGQTLTAFHQQTLYGTEERYTRR